MVRLATTKRNHRHLRERTNEWNLRVCCGIGIPRGAPTKERRGGPALLLRVGGACRDAGKLFDGPCLFQTVAIKIETSIHGVLRMTVGFLCFFIDGLIVVVLVVLSGDFC